MRKFRNINWEVQQGSNGQIATWQAVEISVLMDIRDELQKLNALLHCDNFVQIPTILRGIRTKIPARKKAAKRVRK